MGTVVSAVGTVGGIAGNLIGSSNSSGAAESAASDANQNALIDKMAAMIGFQNAYNDFASNRDSAISTLNNAGTTVQGYGTSAQNTLNSLYGNYQQALKDANAYTMAGIDNYDDFYNKGVNYLNSSLQNWDNTYNQIRSDESPYMSLGTQGATGYSNLLSDPSSVASDPGYQFGLNQGVNALDRSAAAKGLVLSGSQQKAVDQYGQDYASTKYDTVLNRYMNAANLGQTATSAVNNAGLTTAAGKASVYNSLANLGATTASGESSLLQALSNLGMTAASGESSVGQASANADLNIANILAGLSKTTASEYDTQSGLINSLWGNTLNAILGVDKDNNQTQASAASASASAQNNGLSGAINSLNGGIKNYLTTSGYGNADNSLLSSYFWG